MDSGKQIAYSNFEKLQKVKELYNKQLKKDRVTYLHPGLCVNLVESLFRFAENLIAINCGAMPRYSFAKTKRWRSNKSGDWRQSFSELICFIATASWSIARLLIWSKSQDNSNSVLTLGTACNMKHLPVLQTVVPTIFTYKKALPKEEKQKSEKSRCS